MHKLHIRRRRSIASYVVEMLIAFALTVIVFGSIAVVALYRLSAIGM